jgi:iron complex outermembrane recepter protein
MHAPLTVRLYLLSLLTLPTAAALAQVAPSAGEPSDPSEATQKLTPVRISGNREADAAFNRDSAATVNKSSVPLSETPQSVTVVSRALMDSQQAQTLADALHNAPGVVSNQFGRRGWDDLIIRGQVASDSLYLDGLRTAASNRVAEQLFGLEQVEVLKGPASLLYGLVLPGGLVNMVSKRPQSKAFANADVTVGSHGFYQGSVDMGRPLSDNGKAAFRVNALAMNSDDATDHVWFKNRWIAPSVSLDLGPRTDFTLLSSYQERSYIRQQGLPLSGSVQANPNGSIARNRFTGEPGQDPYHGFEGRLGYVLTHRFDNGWTAHHALRWQQFSLDGQLVANSSLKDNRTLTRTATDQHWDGDTITQDTHLQRSFATPFGMHELTLGVDYLRTREDARSITCKVGTLDVYAPVYGSAITCPTQPKTSSADTVRSTGFYLRDQMQFGERWRVVAGLRRDDASSDSTNRLTGKRSDNPSSATTGSVAMMYELRPGVRPYLSYASSFYPNSGVDWEGKLFDPETGRQWEGGVKFELAGGKAHVTLAAFELRRRQVLVSDPDPQHDGFSIAVGEQRTRGLEIGVVMDLSKQLSLMGGYAYTAAVITDDGGQDENTVGDWLDNVPRHSFSATARYRLSQAGSGWEVNAGMRGESVRHAYGYEIPGYVVADAGIAYSAARWRAALTVKNLLDQDYFSGGLRSAVALGDGRGAMLTIGYRY